MNEVLKNMFKRETKYCHCIDKLELMFSYAFYGFFRRSQILVNYTGRAIQEPMLHRNKCTLCMFLNSLHRNLCKQKCGPKMILKFQECIYYSECEKNTLALI